MLYVEVRSDSDAYWYDARRYLEALPGFADGLPSGARAWASDTRHYDFASTHCVKDLSLEAFDVQPSVTLRLFPNPWKHERGLEIRYQGVTSFELDVRQPVDSPPPTVNLDEVLPHEAGCQHEVVFHGGHLIVIAADLTARWIAD